MISCFPETFHDPLTGKGIKQVKEITKEIENKNIDLVFASDILRTKQTAEIVTRKIGKEIKFDKRLREYNFGELNGTFFKEYCIVFPNTTSRFIKKPKGGENYKEITKRMWSFFAEINKKYSGKNILIISHQAPLTLLLGKIYNLSQDKIFKNYFGNVRIKNAQLIELK
jgi:broad specificity phosphatase PhoE